ncbi:hypothetical protein [Escherichia phage ST2]|nr:hypothetical protein [Escherichia phage ST2]
MYKLLRAEYNALMDYKNINQLRKLACLNI